MTAIILALLGGVVGAALLNDFGGFVVGAAIGALGGWVAELGGPRAAARAAARSAEGVAGEGRSCRAGAARAG